MPEEKDNLKDNELKANILPELSAMDEEPELDVELPANSGRGTGLSEQESMMPDQSDLKAIIRRLIPDFDDVDIDELAKNAKPLVVSRVSPDMFVEGMRSTIYSIIKRHRYDGIRNKKPVVMVTYIINCIFAIYSMALEGKVRIELVELAGAAKENEEAEKIANRMGF